ncbi:MULTISPECIES: hypothetical protein [unclassified Coleofasciculus]|uniref:hypothetical protein n=1 Tax=unclassified Coleofasciculus TaxID=2692782 RepID=UPI001882E8DB|nr:MULTISPECIES: hypothetical protein [unclassified Coleofasciculus]MBE9127841.1 hypothetical protein [Coleofasciculus sp. LEGE 07081]MBE9148085.1 hypothetical protein [Coleofasciculus sp. LEGE 07092]
MNVPDTLVNQLKLYLKHRADNGDLEAKTLLTQIEQLTTAPTLIQMQAMDILPPEGFDMGC